MVLSNQDTFMQILKGRFHTLKQGKWLVTGYIQDFHSLARHLRDWPKCMLISYFQEGLNQELYQYYIPRGVLHNLQV